MRRRWKLFYKFLKKNNNKTILDPNQLENAHFYKKNTDLHPPQTGVSLDQINSLYDLHHIIILVISLLLC